MSELSAATRAEAARAGLIVSADWLAERLSAPDIVVVDASWHLPNAGRDARAEYLAGHIPGAVFFDIDAISDADSPLPHMLPKPLAFSAAVRRLGIGDGQTIVVYDSVGLYSAARAWWTFRAMGVERVLVLDGGLPAWTAAGHPLEEGEVKRPERAFTARLDNGLVADIEAVRTALAGGRAVVDARAAERFEGRVPEPRPGLRAGHMPGAKSVPFGAVLADGKLKPAAEIAAAFTAAGVDPAKPAVTTCGSGVTAAILTLALASLGNRAVALYDGSWAEWGSRDDTDVATGAG
jgi:thiosulfate/3-mercaptopyruvate sulfurtransferase